MRLTPIKAIRLKCLDCCCNSANEVKFCKCNSCALYPYRFGKRPRGTEELEAMAKIEKEHSYLGTQDEKDED